MNERFVPVKVDREERPDVDGLYMEAVVTMTGHGGWPMTVFLTPDGRPFYGGTYFPPEPRFNMPSFTQLLDAVSQAYKERRTRARAAGRRPGRRDPGGERAPAVQRAADFGADRQRRVRASRAVRPRATAASGARRSSPRPRTSSSCSAPGATTRSTWCARLSTGWPPAACTTCSAEASTATPWTRPGSYPTSRRCSTTTRCSPRRTSTPGSSPGRSATGASPRRRSTTWPATSGSRKVASPPRRTPTRTASKV